LTFRDNAGGKYYNSIFTEYGKGADFELLSSGECTYNRFQAGDLLLSNNIFWNIGANNPNNMFTLTGDGSLNPTDSSNALAALTSSFSSQGNAVADPQIGNITREATGNLNPIPASPSATSGATPASDPWFTPATFKGAFGPNDNWLTGWTALDANGYM